MSVVLIEEGCKRMCESKFWKLFKAFFFEHKMWYWADFHVAFSTIYCINDLEWQIRLRKTTPFLASDSGSTAFSFLNWYLFPPIVQYWNYILCNINWKMISNFTSTNLFTLSRYWIAKQCGWPFYFSYYMRPYKW